MDREIIIVVDSPLKFFDILAYSFGSFVGVCNANFQLAVLQ